MSRCQITEEDMVRVLAARSMLNQSVKVIQSALELGDSPRTYLLSVFVDGGYVFPELVMVY